MVSCGLCYGTVTSTAHSSCTFIYRSFSLMHTLSVFIPSCLCLYLYFPPSVFNLLFPIENSPSGRPHCQRNQPRPREKNRLKATPGHIMQSDYFFFSPRLRPLFRPETCNLALSRVILLPSLGRTHLLATCVYHRPAPARTSMVGTFIDSFFSRLPCVGHSAPLNQQNPALPDLFPIHRR
jgi:hypothetical protein